LSMTFALRERVALSAGTNACCLTDFIPVQVSEPAPQSLTLDLTAYFAANAICVRSGATDNETFARTLAETRHKFSSFGIPPSVIRARQLVFFPRLDDISLVDGAFRVAEPQQPHLQLFDNFNDLNPKDISARHQSIERVADDCLEEMYAEVDEAPDDLIHVTSSGYLAPSPVQRLAARRGWLRTTVTHGYHMGCYGGFSAIRMAHGFLASAQLGVTPPKERVDIVHTEILSAHHEVEELTAQNIVTMTLFSDGFIKYSVATEDHLRARGLAGLKILAYTEHLLANSADAETLAPGPTRFRIYISIMTPVFIKAAVNDLVNDLMRRAGLDFERERHRLMFAIHPGGPRVVEHIQPKLKLDDDQVAFSKAVLLENGNMSSATVPHILKSIVEEPSVPFGSRVIAIGFGPGLTMTGLLLQKI